VEERKTVWHSVSFEYIQDCLKDHGTHMADMTAQMLLSGILQNLTIWETWGAQPWRREGSQVQPLRILLKHPWMPSPILGTAWSGERGPAWERCSGVRGPTMSPRLGRSGQTHQQLVFALSVESWLEHSQFGALFPRIILKFWVSCFSTLFWPLILLLPVLPGRLCAHLLLHLMHEDENAWRWKYKANTQFYDNESSLNPGWELLAAPASGLNI
jgi:hypothetical protein